VSSLKWMDGWLAWWVMDWMTAVWWVGRSQKEGLAETDRNRNFDGWLDFEKMIFLTMRNTWARIPNPRGCETGPARIAVLFFPWYKSNRQCSKILVLRAPAWLSN
jgi:hypothetical protein